MISLGKLFKKIFLLSIVDLPAMQETEDMGSIPGSRKSPGGGNGSPLQYSCPEKKKIAWTEKPGRLQSMGLQRVSYD